jgi:hypothetical protein
MTRVASGDRWQWESGGDRGRRRRRGGDGYWAACGGWRRAACDGWRRATGVMGGVRRHGDGCWAACDGWHRAMLGVEEDGVVMMSVGRRVVGAVG